MKDGEDGIINIMLNKYFPKIIYQKYKNAY